MSNRKSCMITASFNCNWLSNLIIIKYFNTKIKHLVDELKITDDLSYLLLNYYHWDDSKIIKQTRETPKECLVNLHLNLGSESFPTISSPIQATEGPVGECPICLLEYPLIHFHCGHKMCKKCFDYHIKSQDIPQCNLVDDQTNQICNALILPSDIRKYCNDQQVLSKYEKNLVARNEINIPNIAVCAHCNLILTEKDNIGCHTAQCPKCHFVSCYKCNHGCHAPVLNCKNVDDFLSVKSNYNVLKDKQNLWFDRERRLVQYRREHLDEVNEYFDNETKKLTEKINNSDKSAKEKSDFIASLKEIKEDFIKSINSDPKIYDFNIVKFTEKIDFLSSMYANHDSHDDQNEILIVHCPKCNAPIERNAGCIHLTCVQCRIEFCSKCGQIWNSDHTNFYNCPFVDENKTEEDSNDDKKFYPMPLDLEKRIQFNDWNDLHSKYLKNFEKLDAIDSLFIEERRDGIYPKLVNALKKNINEEKSKEIVSKFLHDILFGQTIVTYGFVQLYYTENKEKHAQLEKKLNEIELKVNEIIDNISKPEIENPGEFINTNAALLNDNIKCILNLVESQ